MHNNGLCVECNASPLDTCCCEQSDKIQIVDVASHPYSGGIGLDARAAAIVMRTVRNIVNTGRTIVCTIHQPSIDIFESFDELLLLKRGGQTIYAGHTTHSLLAQAAFILVVQPASLCFLCDGTIGCFFFLHG